MALEKAKCAKEERQRQQEEEAWKAQEAERKWREAEAEKAQREVEAKKAWRDAEAKEAQRTAEAEEAQRTAGKGKVPEKQVCMNCLRRGIEWKWDEGGQGKSKIIPSLFY